MLKLFAIQTCVCCGKQTRIASLRMWARFPAQDKLYCSDKCIWEYGRVLQRQRLAAIADMAQAIIDDAEVQLANMRRITIKSRAAAVELKSIQQSMVSITQQLDKVETR
jgi:hypothetical protein